MIGEEALASEGKGLEEKDSRPFLCGFRSPWNGGEPFFSEMMLQNCQIMSKIEHKEKNREG